MALVGYSDDFELDDNGILRDSMESGGILIDDDGIVRDDFDILSKHGSSTHWTDSGLGGDKPSSTPSALRQLDFQSYPSFEDVSRKLDESHVNISDFEASKDDLSFNDDYNNAKDGDPDKSLKGYRSVVSNENRSGLSSRSSFDHSLNHDETFDDDSKKVSGHKQDIFDEEYYRQLQELGVLVDEDDFIRQNTRNFLPETENSKAFAREYEDDETVHDNQMLTRDFTDTERTDERLRQLEKKMFKREDLSAFGEHKFEAVEPTEGKRTRPISASSSRTISSRSFPEISPEEAQELYTERVHSMDDDSNAGTLSIPFEQSQSEKTDNNYVGNDEIFFVASQENDISPKSAKVPAYNNENGPSLRPKPQKKQKSDQSITSDRSRSVTPQGQNDCDSRSLTPQGEMDHGANNDYQSSDRVDSLTQVSGIESRNKTFSETDAFRSNSALSQISSAASEGRSLQPIKNRSVNKPPKQQPKSGLPHARSQESFFDHQQESGPKKVEKGPKRLLPKPGAGEDNRTQSLKIKCKSTTNLQAFGPVKPTHMSLAEIRNIAIDDDFELTEHDKNDTKSGASDVPKGELTQKLKQESSKRQQATQLVKQLQHDYDKLLSKYALAELTIDQMRLGAKISIHANSPTPSQATSGSLQSAQHLHLLQLAGAQRGSVVAALPQQAISSSVFLPEPVQHHSVFDNRMVQQRGTSPAPLPRSDSINSMDSTSTPRGDVEPTDIANDAEKIKFGLLFQARNLNERMQSFQTLMAENHLSAEEQESVLEQIRSNHEKLRRDYLQSKEDYNVLRRSTPALDVAFDQEKELEGELFKLGMKFDEIHEQVEDKMKEKAAKRQPFQKKLKENDDSTDTSVNVDPYTENVKKKVHSTVAGNDLLEPKQESEFDKKLKQLHEEYNALMDRYRRLKQMTKTPERDQEIDNLVKKLRKICKEEPDIFKLPADAQLGWEQTKQTGNDARQMSRLYENGTNRMSRSQENLNTSLSSSKSFRSDRSLHGEPASTRLHDDHDTHLQGKDHSGSYSSLSSRGRHSPDSSSHDRNSPVPGLPRPRHHDYPERERKDRMLFKKTPEGGSTTSLGDSGISEHEGGATGGGHSLPNSPLSKLPGPGKFKQMTGRRELDTDSGFIGSVVGSEVSAWNLSSRRQPPQPTLRLRHPGDLLPNQRPSSRQSNRSEDSAQSATSRSIQSAASSQSSSRRTPTKAFPLVPEGRQTMTEVDRTLGQTLDDRQGTLEDRHTPNHVDSRAKFKVQQKPQYHNKDNRNDSYTSVTDSDISFDSDTRHKLSNRQNTSQHGIDQILEDNEEEQYSIDPSLNETTDLNMTWLTSDSERPSVTQNKRKHNTQLSQKKPPGHVKNRTQQTQQSNVGQGQTKAQSISAQQMTDDDTSLTFTPTQDTTRDITHNTTHETDTSDETTPRSVIERERKEKLRMSEKPHVEKLVKSQTTLTQTLERPITPLKAKKSEVHPKKLHEILIEGARTKLTEQPVAAPKYVDQSIGSGSEDTSDAETTATRDSVNSQRLKILANEIGKLRDEFVRANQQLPQQHAPPAAAPPPQQQNQYYDQYFDPTEDPLAFMRGPRRRANSFSGHGGHDWDYDWTLPNVNRDGDIPLGYAAAESYATHRSRKHHESEEEPRTRGRQRLHHRIKQRNAATQHIVEQYEYDSDQSPTRVPVDQGLSPSSSVKVHGHYGYDTPQADVTSPEQHATQSSIPPLSYPTQLQPGTHVYGSQPNLAYNGYQLYQHPRSIASGSTRSSTSQTTSSKPVRHNFYSYSANPNQNRTGIYQQEYGSRLYTNNDIYINDGQTQFIPNGAVDVPHVQSDRAVYTSTCPLCGSSSYHTHGDFVYPPEDYSQPLGYLLQDGRQIVACVKHPVYALPQHSSPFPQTYNFIPSNCTSDCSPHHPPVCFSTLAHQSQSQSLRKSQSLRRTQSLKIFKTSPQIKPALLPLNNRRIVIQPQTMPLIPPPSLQPMTVFHDDAQQPLNNKIIIIQPQTTPPIPPPSLQPITVFHDDAQQPVIVKDTPKEGEVPRVRTTRSRSFSHAGRIRHYSPDGRIQNRYFVREFGNEGESGDSEDEKIIRDRSHSLGRQRLRHDHKYRRGDDGDEGGMHSSTLTAASEDGLNRSLQLVNEIDQLTHKMMDTVGSELTLSRHRLKFGSSMF